jgi:hypothetical protein
VNEGNRSLAGVRIKNIAEIQNEKQLKKIRRKQ